jgi:hypothetical protein
MLASVGWGLKGSGLYCVAVILAALVGVRFLATESTTSVVNRNSGVTAYPLLRRNSRRLSSGPCALGCLFPPSL